MAAADAQAGAAAEEQPQLAPEPQAATEPQPGLDLTADGHAESTAHIDTHSTAPALPQSPTGTHVLPGAPSTQPAPLSPFALDTEVPAEAQTRDDPPGADESLSLVLDALGQGSTAEPTSTLNAPSTTAFESDLLSIAPHATDETTDLAAAHVQSEIELQSPRGEEHEQVSEYQLGPELDTTNTTPTLSTTTPTPVNLAEPAITEEIRPNQEEAAALPAEAADPELSLPHTAQPAEQQLPGGLDGSPTPGADDDMSNPPHYPGMPGQHLGYADQTGYATAAANTPFGYANPASQSPDGYQGSPTTPNHATSLPSIRAYDQVRPHPQHIQPQSHLPTPQYGTGVPQGVSPTAGNVGFYQQPASLVSSSAYSSIAPDPMNPRYPLPPNEHSLLTSNRHKKEIKRRTKTGCLTCRKRRIKCDEQHPVCKNCQKSKRECLGYDPIFKQQPLHPTTIQPALNHTAHSPNGAYSATSASPVATTFAGMAATPVEVKKMNVDELVSMGGATVPSLDSPLTQERIDEIRDLYEQVYALGLEAFFESKWFTSPQAVQALASNTAISEMLAGFLQCVSNSDANDATSMQLSANLEFRVVWDLACLVCSAPASAAGIASNTLVPDEATETRHRVTVLAALLSGDYLYSNPLTAPPPVGDSFRLRELTFWHCIAEFLCIKDDGASDRTGRREHVLSRTRDVLDGRENRDVIYSFAVIRALSPGVAPNFENYLPPHLNEADPKSRLAVARKFIQDEAQVTGGTTNVVRRFAELAVRAFIVPGSNIQR